MEKTKISISGRILVIVAIAAILLATALFVWNRGQQTSKTPNNANLPVDHISTGLIGEYASLIIIAQQQEYFKDNGLSVTITEYPSGPAALKGLLAGNIDMAMGSDFAGVSNSFTAPDLKVLGTLSKAQAFFIVARKDRGISEIDNLRNKTIGLTSKTVGEFFLDQFLVFNNLPIDEVRTVNMEQADLVMALQKGEIDAAVLFEPNAYRANMALGTNGAQWLVQSGQSIYTCLYSTDSFTRQKPEAINRYMRALVQAERFIRDNDAKSRVIVARYLGYDDAYINYIWPQFTFNVTLEQELLISMHDQASWAIENQLTESTKVPNYLNHLYMDAIKTVKPEGVTVIH